MEHLTETLVPAKEFVPARILLLDCNTETRAARSNALKGRGAVVDCADSAASAMAMWSPGSHELVLIDLLRAGAEVEEFCRYIQGASARQKVGFYMLKPPYITLSRAKYEADCRPVAAVAVPPPSPVETRQGPLRQRVGVREAAMRIAALRIIAGASTPKTTDHAGRPAPEPLARPRVSFADAVKLAERACAEVPQSPPASEEQ